MEKHGRPFLLIDDPVKVREVNAGMPPVSIPVPAEVLVWSVSRCVQPLSCFAVPSRHRAGAARWRQGRS